MNERQVMKLGLYMGRSGRTIWYKTGFLNALINQTQICMGERSSSYDKYLNRYDIQRAADVLKAQEF